MLGRAARAVLFAGTMIAVWLIASPALAASAPLCDDRGATGLAPPPALQSPEDAFVRARSIAPDCFGGATRDLAFVSSHDAPAPPAADGDSAVPISLARVERATSTACALPNVAGDARDAVAARVERPPRA